MYMHASPYIFALWYCVHGPPCVCLQAYCPYQNILFTISSYKIMLGQSIHPGVSMFHQLVYTNIYASLHVAIHIFIVVPLFLSAFYVFSSIYMYSNPCGIHPPLPTVLVQKLIHMLTGYASSYMCLFLLCILLLVPPLCLFHFHVHYCMIDELMWTVWMLKIL